MKKSVFIGEYLCPNKLKLICSFNKSGAQRLPPLIIDHSVLDIGYSKNHWARCKREEIKFVTNPTIFVCFAFYYLEGFIRYRQKRCQKDSIYIVILAKKMWNSNFHSWSDKKSTCRIWWSNSTLSCYSSFR